MTLNEAKEFLLKIGQLGELEIENSTSNIPTDELRQWNDCFQNLICSSEFKEMQDLIDRLSNIDKRRH